MKPPLDKLKTGALSRQLSIAKTSLTIGKNIAKHNLSALFARPEDAAAKKQEMLSEQAQYLAAELGKLKGSVVKIGQMLALYGENTLPKAIVDALHTLDNDTAALDFSTAEQAVRDSIGACADDFAIDPTPIGAASLAQVHKATHKPSGQTVALKIQYPGVADAIDADLALIRRLLKITNAAPQTKALDAWFEEARALLKNEVDYKKEAAATARFFERLKDSDAYIVPRVYPNYSADRLLCLSFEEGVSPNDDRLKRVDQSRRDRLGQNALIVVLRELFEWNEMQTDPNFGNYRIRLDPDGRDRLVLLDFGAVKSFDPNLVDIAKNMLRAGHHQDRDAMIAAMANHDFFDRMSAKVKADLADVFLLATEPFARFDALPNCPCFDENGRYIWAKSDLYARVAKLAKKHAQSLEFVVPPKETMFISRKFIGAYALLVGLEARTDAAVLAKWLD